MMKIFFAIFITALLLFGQSAAEETDGKKDTAAIMAERYVIGMGNIASKKLAEKGMSQSDVRRISGNLSDTIRGCLSHTIELQSKGNPSEVQWADDYLEHCVRIAFERAGITFP